MRNFIWLALAVVATQTVPDRAEPVRILGCTEGERSFEITPNSFTDGEVAVPTVCANGKYIPRKFR